MAKRECPVGWLLTPSSTDGEYVPFFIKVRDCDIVWNKNTLPNDIITFINQKINSDVNTYYPMTEFKCIVGMWNVTLYQDFSYKATARLPIQQYVKSNTTNKITMEVNLPFRTNNDKTLSFNSNISAYNIDMVGSNTNIIVNEVSSDQVDSLNIELYSGLYPFSDNVINLTEYKNDCVVITVNGVVGDDHVVNSHT